MEANSIPGPIKQSTGAPVERNGAAGHLPHAAAVASTEAGKVMLQFQELMAKFLDTQKSVMQQYLAASGSAPVATHLPPAAATVAPAVSTNGHSHHKPLHPPSHVPADVASAPNAKAAEPVTAIEPIAIAKPAIDRNWLENELLELICKRTGYPRDMVGADLDLEADLGIDSIKRVEILGTLAESLGEGDSGPPQDLAMEKLTGIKTLRGILDYLEPIFSKTETNGHAKSALPGPAANATEPKTEHASNGVSHRDSHAPPKRQHDVQRALIRLIDAPLPHGETPMLPAGTTVIVDDGQGVAQAISTRLADFGQDAVIVRHVDAATGGATDDFAVDLCDASAVAGLALRLRQNFGAIAGLIHLLPLANCGTVGNYDRARRDARSLYLLTRNLEADLRNAGKTGSSICFTVTALGGGLGFENRVSGASSAGEGGPIGFAKCLAFEWPEVVVRAIDVDASLSADLLAESILSELTERDGPMEVGRLGNRRVTWEPFAAAVDRGRKPSIELTEQSTVLVTGGARGITATVSLELATRFRCKLILVGRSAEPDEEADETRLLTDPAAIKSAIMKRFEREGRMIAPAAVESAYRRLLSDREIRDNLAKIRKTGAEVHYYGVDVRDQSAFSSLIDEIGRRFGGIDAVIHGAGVIEDKLVRDKTPESFDRVFETKVRSALLLAEKLDPNRVKALLLFSSIASRYGNKGQSDYAAANETLSKLAHDLDRRWPGRVAAIAWGPWAEVGMVADLQKHLIQRGLKLISPTEGPKFVVDELLYGVKGEAEVIVAGGADHMARPVRAKAVATV